MVEDEIRFFRRTTDQSTPVVNLEWRKEKSPVLLIQDVFTTDDLLTKVKRKRSTLSFATRLGTLFDTRINLVNIWRIITTIILPMFWVIVSLRILLQLFNEIYTQSETLTLIFLLIVSFTFSSPVLYVLARRRHDYLDETDQINLIKTLLKNNPEVEETELLHHLLYFDESGKKPPRWKQFQSNWDLSLFYPEYTAFDFIGLFTSIFSIVYLFTWLVKVLGILSFAGDRTAFRDAVLYLDILLIMIFIGFLITGGLYGLRSDWRIQWDENMSKRYMGISIGLLLIGILGTVVIEILTGQFLGTFVFFILIFEIPLISSFIVNRIRLFIEFNGARINLLRLLAMDNVEAGEKLKHMKLDEDQRLVYRQIFVNETTRSLSIKTPVPATRIRSYTLIITAIFSLITTIITAFVGSTDLFSQLIRSFF